jgi:UDP-N-acetylglucosamine 2-epimerase (non-hydrolysing)
VKKIISVVGARPNFMKVAPLHRAFRERKDAIRHLIVHTGQHYDRQMSKVFFEDLELPEPDVYLGVGSGSHAQQTAKVMVEFEKVAEKEKPDLAIVVGDVNSTVACSLDCAKMHIPVAHVEAGLRSFDRSMPEEINRLLTDAIADYLFVTERSGMKNLEHEGIGKEKIFFVGNTMIDSLISYRKKAQASPILRTLGVQPKSYALVTLHRPSNVDNKENLGKIFDLLTSLSEKTVVIFPVHPRTRKMISEFGLQTRMHKIRNLKLLEPLGYIDFLAMMEGAQFLMTDSGGIQEETTYLGVPCLTLRTTTERPVTVETGTNELCGEDFDLALKKGFEILDGKRKQGCIPELWDGKAAERIAAIIEDGLK